MISKRLFALLFLICGIVGATVSQEKKQFCPNQFEVKLSTGVMFNKVNTLSGETYLINNISPKHSLEFDYRRLLTENISMFAVWGFGFQSHRFKTNDTENVLGNFYSRHNMDYNIFYTLQLGSSYSVDFKNKTGIEFSLSGGIYQGAPSGYTYGWIGEDENVFSDYLDVDNLSHVVPVVKGELCFTKPLANKNIFKLGVSYTQGFRDVYTGVFSLTDPNSAGVIYSKGSNISLQVGYSFTGRDKKEKLENLLVNGEDLKIAKKQIRKERRYFSPQSTFVSVLGGIGVGMNLIDNPDGILMNGGYPSLTAGLNIEQGIRNNLFVECGYQLLEYQDMIKIKALFVSSFGSEAFLAHEFNLGGGYRLISKNNYPILNIRIGLKGGFTAEGIGVSSGGLGGGSGTDYEGNEFSYAVTSTDEIVAKFICAAYLGISKDFRIVDRFYLSLDYKYQQGLNPIYKSYITYESSSFEGTRHAVKTINATAHYIQLGLKFKVGEIGAK